MNRLCCFTLFSAVLGAASTVAAQASLPVSVTGGGTVSYFTAIPTEWTPFGGEGTISFNGVDLAYTLTSADVGGLMVTDGGPPVVANFSNSVPVTFSSTDPGEDSEISMNYQGVVTLTPASDTEFTGVFVADFTPIVGSGTGIFAGVIGGGFEMTAIADTPFVARLDESQVDGLTLDAPYEWGTTGGANDFFQVVPEPTALVLGALAVLAGATRRRGASPLS